MAFPTTPTTVRLDLNINGVWTNVTSDVYTSEGINISRGRQDEASSPEASSLSFVLNNRTGNYNPRNPSGIYYPNLTRNTPVRVGVGIPPAGSGLGNQTGTAIVAPASTAEQAGIAISCWAVESPSATITVPGGYTAAGTFNATFASSRAASASVSAGAVGTATATSSVSAANAAATCVIPGGSSIIGVPGGGFNSYAVGGTDLSPITAGPFTVLAGDVMVACVMWSQDPSNAMVCSPWDDSQASEWALTADSGITIANSPRVQIWTRYCPVGASLNLQTINWVTGAADVSVTYFQVRGAAAWNPRYHGFCMDFSTTADLSGNDVRCTVNAGSILRQRGQGTQTPHSALFRYLSNSNSAAYWPLEGGTQTQALASPFAGVPQATVTDVAVAFGQDSTSFVASDALPVVTSGYFQGLVPSYTGGNGGGVYAALNITAAPTATGQGLLWALLSGGGSIGTAIITYNSTTNATLTIFNVAGAVITSQNVGWGSMIATPRYWFINWNPNPGNPGTQVDFDWGFYNTSSNTFLFSALTGVTGTIGTCIRVSAGQEPSNTSFFDKGLTVGHMAVASSGSGAASGPSSNPTSTFPKVIGTLVATAWQTEEAVRRIVRVCQEESIPLSIPYIASLLNLIPLGAQQSDSALNILATVQATDLGELAESRCTPGFMYRTGASMTARPVVTSVDYTGKMITGTLQPTDDDQLTRNDVTVTQQNGSSVEVMQTTGPLSVLLPPAGVGIYTQSVDVTLYQQVRDQPQVAALYLAQGTVNQQRFKSVQMQLAAVPSSVTALSSIDVGNHVQIINTPNWVQPGPSDVIVLGLKETIGPIADWMIELNAKPYGVNAVLRVDSGDTMSRVDSGSSTVTSNITNSGTSMSVTTARSTDLWANANAPFDILVAGERMTVTAISGTTSPQTFTVTRSVNGVVKAQTAGTAVDVYYQTYAGLAGT